VSTSRTATLRCDYSACATEITDRTRTLCRRQAKGFGWYMVKGDSATVKTGMDVDYCSVECHDRALARAAETAERNRQAKLNRDAFANMISYEPMPPMRPLPEVTATEAEQQAEEDRDAEHGMLMEALEADARGEMEDPDDLLGSDGPCSCRGGEDR
jgi:hypothetical protein